MLQCCIRRCPDSSEEQHLYGLPTHYPSKQSWLAKVRDKIDVSCVEFNKSQVLICHLHFKPEDFVYILHSDGSHSKQLNEKACPSIFPEEANQWSANYFAHQQLNQPNNNSLQSSNDSITDASIVELGNVESLGILVEAPQQCSQNLSSSENKKQIASSCQTNENQAAQFSPQKPLFSSPDAKRSIFSSRSGNSPLLPSRLHYSCTECNFKTSDVIVLKNHRNKHHVNWHNKLAIGKATVPESGISNQRENETIPISESNQATYVEDLSDSPVKKLKVQEAYQSTTSIPSDDEIEHVCQTCGFTTANIRTMIDHQATHNMDGSSTEELSEEENVKEKSVSNNSQTINRAEEEQLGKAIKGNSASDRNYVYRCPDCDFWTRFVNRFHNHLIVEHKKQKTFQCNRCGFKSSTRHAVTKHINRMQEAADKNHIGASWAVVTEIQPIKSSDMSRDKKDASFDARASSSTESKQFEHKEGSTTEPQNLTKKEERAWATKIFVKNEDIKLLLSNAEEPSESEAVNCAIEVKSGEDSESDTTKRTSQEQGPSFKRNLNLTVLIQQYRSSRNELSKLKETISSKNEQIVELSATQKQNLLQEQILNEHYDALRKSSSALLTEKLQTEMQLREHQRVILGHRLALLKSTNKNEAELAKRAIEIGEKERIELETKLRHCEQQVNELETEEKSCYAKLVDLKESNASVEKTISDMLNELSKDEKRSTALEEGLATLNKRSAKLISDERNRIRKNSMIQRARAVCNYKRSLVMLQKKERKRLMRLDHLLEDL